jgi:hypothetical protein
MGHREMKKTPSEIASQEEMRNCAPAVVGDEYKSAADEQEIDVELAELVKARQHESRITVTLDEL